MVEKEKEAKDGPTKEDQPLPPVELNEDDEAYFLPNDNPHDDGGDEKEELS